MSGQSSQSPEEKSPQRLFTQLQHNGWLQTLMAQAKKLEHLQQLFAQAAGADLAQQCRVVAFEKDSLLVEASSAVWASRVRYSSGQLITTLQQNQTFAYLQYLHCLVSPAALAVKPCTHSAPYPISTTTAHSIAAMATTLDDKELRDALLQLAEGQLKTKKTTEG